MKKMDSFQKFIEENKISVILVFCLLYALVLGYFFVRRDYKPPVQTEQKAIKEKKEVVSKKQSEKKLKTKTNSVTKVITKTYDKDTGKLVKETTKETKTISKKQEDTKVKEETKKEVSKEINKTVTFVKPNTGITSGVLVTPSGLGLVGGVTLLEFKPVSLNANAGILLYPSQVPVAGISVNGEISTNLEAGIGVYLGPQTVLGLQPISGIPVSVQPGVTIQYKF